jgi:adenylate kinase
MDQQAAIVARVERACQRLGVDSALARRLVEEAFLPELRAAVADNQRLAAERDQMTHIQNEVQKLVQAPTPQKIVHDLRNILNELGLLRAIAGEDKRD